MRLLTALVLFAALVSPAFAAEPEPSVRPVFEPDGRFGFCLGEQTYVDGRKLTMALSPKEELNIGATIPAAGFKREARYDVLLQIENDKARKIRAVALDSETLLLQMGGNRAFQDKLMATKSLSVGAGGKKIAFALPPMDRFFGTIQKCIDDNKGKKLLRDETSLQAPVQAPVQAPHTLQAPVGQAAPPSAQEDLPPSIHNLLKTAGVWPVRPLSLANVPEANRPADYIWETGSIMGGVRERQAPAHKTLSALIGLHMRGLEKKCGGDFTANVEREKHAPHFRLRKAEATCAPENPEDGQAITVGIVFYLLDGKTFAVFTHEGTSKDKAETFAARDKIAKTLLERAREVGKKKL